MKISRIRLESNVNPMESFTARPMAMDSRRFRHGFVGFWRIFVISLGLTSLRHDDRRKKEVVDLAADLSKRNENGAISGESNPRFEVFL